MQHRQFPIGIQDFEDLRNRECYYVDKTDLIYKLTREGKCYFLSRPRRFGKSLLVSTLHYLFAGYEALFKGLTIHKHWDWSQQHPVIRLSFNGGECNTPKDIERCIIKDLSLIEEEAELKIPDTPDSTAPERLKDVLYRLHKTTQKQVVVLVDEYDEPILDVMTNTEQATVNRNYLRRVYGVLKDCDRHIHFIFFTGTSMFSMLHIFSSLNNLEDISLDPEYATICGYTDQDLDSVFAAELIGLDREEIRRWYNGYHWSGGKKVYNPHSILCLLKKRKFMPWWYKTSVPKHIYDLLRKMQITPIEIADRLVDEDVISSFDVSDIKIDALLFQSGYLTIAEEKTYNGMTKYRLDYPNFEVQQSLNKGLFAHITGLDLDTHAQGREMIEALSKLQFQAFKNRLYALLARVRWTPFLV